MSRMAELPDDALRCICEQLVPPSAKYLGQSNEEFMAEAQEYCDEHTTWTALQTCDEEGLDDVSAECQYLTSDLGERIRQWHRKRGPVAVQLRLVSRDWRGALEKPTNILKAELARLKQHQVMLDDAYSRAHSAFLSRFGPEY